MHITYAQLPSSQDSDDRVFTAPHVVIVLDGASAFKPVPVAAASYADTLGRHLIDLLVADPTANLHDSLSKGIKYVAAKFNLRAGESPSSTVSIIRETKESVDVLVLGDSPVIIGKINSTHMLTDERLKQLTLPERDAYQTRLAAGRGFDDQHSALLVQLQAHEARYRNRPGGYWIAEADPAAGHHAVYQSFRKNLTTWALVATDGAADSLNFLTLNNWSTLIQLDAKELGELLRHCQDWETQIDDGGQIRPRAKRHDDKTLVTIRFDRPP
jgi:hypothetical protein